MEVKFANYRFLSEQFILYKNDELIPLKRNQAVLLNFFLSNPEGIHSKDTILDVVWQDRVVSEQVVFQTISQLRALLGDDAIKTFSKKGYKWQLTVIPKQQEKNESGEVHYRTESESTNKTSYKKLSWLWAIISLLATSIIIATYMYSVKLTKNEAISLKNRTSFNILYNKKRTTRSQAQFNNILSNVLAQSSSFSSQEKLIASTARQAFAAPKLVWQQANLPVGDWLIWGDIYTAKNSLPEKGHSEKGIFLNFGLSRDNTYWQGYLYAQNAQQLELALAKRLNELDTLGLFTTVNKKLDINTLMSMYNVAQHDPDLLLLLARHYITVQHLDVALTYLQKLTNLDATYGFSAYQAEAQWYIGKIYKMRSQHIQAVNSLDTMSDILADTPLWPLSFHNINTNAWLAHARNDNETMLRIVEQGLTSLQDHADPLTLFELHILNSIVARKVGDDHKKYSHLNQAQALLLKHKLDDSNLAVVYYHFALFTEDKTFTGSKTAAIPYLEQILALPRTMRNDWILNDALEMLVNHHIEQQNFTRANALFNDTWEGPLTLLLKAKVFQAQKKLIEAKMLFEKAFELARLHHDIHTGLQAALSLYHLSIDHPKVRAEYLAYLQSNASSSWLKMHETELASE